MLSLMVNFWLLFFPLFKFSPMLVPVSRATDSVAVNSGDLCCDNVVTNYALRSVCSGSLSRRLGANRVRDFQRTRNLRFYRNTAVCMLVGTDVGHLHGTVMASLTPNLHARGAFSRSGESSWLVGISRHASSLTESTRLMSVISYLPSLYAGFRVVFSVYSLGLTTSIVMISIPFACRVGWSAPPGALAKP